MEKLYIIPSHKIDLGKWDCCITKHPNGLIYAQSDYLNIMTSNWHGIVVGNYKAVMPLPWRRKYGIRYLYTPAFMQQLGFIGSELFDFSLCYKKIKSFALVGDYLFNYNNCLNEHMKATSFNNFILDLSPPIESIRANYRNNLIRNLKRDAARGLRYVKSTDIEGTLAFHYQLQSVNISHVSDLDYAHFSELCQLFALKNQCIVRQVMNENGILLSAALLLKDERRLYYIINVTTSEGKSFQANHYLTDQIINEFSGTELLLDFEGSNIPGIRIFYEMFGAVNQPYLHWHFNSIPWPFSLIKN